MPFYLNCDQQMAIHDSLYDNLLLFIYLKGGEKKF